MNWKRLQMHFRDSTTIEIDDQPTAMHIRSVVRQSKAQAALVVVFVLLWSIFAYRSEWGWKGLAFGGFALASFASTWRPVVDVRLQITFDGFEVFGKFAGGYEPARYLLWSDVVRLEYSGGTGGEDEYSPSGLWAVGPRRSTCLLPGPDEEEAITLAVKIYQRFPNVVMAQDQGYQGFLREELTLLNLNRPD